MSLETIMWTVLPTGRNGNTLNFSLFLSPQLGATGALGSGQFPVFGLWPKRVSSLAVTLEIQGVARPYPAALQLGGISLDHWTRVFPKQTPVIAWGYQDQSGRTVQSYSVSETRAAVNALYDGIATDPALATDHPPLTPGSPVLDLVNNLGRPMGGLLARRQRELLQKGDPNNQLVDQAAKEAFSKHPLAALFYKAWRFYNRPQGSLLPGHAPPKPGLPTDWDFHKAAAMLVDHGSLLRLLGLVIDGSITFNSDSVPPNSGLIRVRDAALREQGAQPANKRPWTHYQIDAAGFLPQPKKGSEIQDGNLRLADPSLFDVFEVDADGAALKTLDFAVNIARHIDTTASQHGDKPQSAALPALRTGGFTISRIDRGAQVEAAFANATVQNASPDTAEVWAEDVTRGYRIDVNFRGNWYTLCRRTGSVTVGPVDDPLVVAVDDEGYIKGPSGTSTLNPGVTVDELYLHEAMVTWKGWSLVATRPGRTIPQPPNHLPVRHVNTAGGFFQVVTDFHAAPKTLPRLRFGEPYRFRARTVDLAGNSLDFKVVPPGTFWDSGPVPFLRYEPISTPALAPRAVFREGEQLENLTVRSEVKHLHPPLDPSLFNDDCQRHVVPPKVSQLTAEEHGRLDPIIASDPALAFRISAKESGTLMDRQIVDPYNTSFDPAVYPAKQVPVADIALVDPSTTPATVSPASDNAKWPANPGDPPLVRGQYIIHTGDTVQLPYLPDPLAKGLALKFPNGAFHYHPFAGTWPDVAPFRLVLQKGPLGFHTGPGGTVIVTTPEGTITTLRYSTLPEPVFAGTMRFARDLTGALQGLALRGQHWMLTPWREITLVHAVEQPMKAPELYKLTADKALAQTYASLRGAVVTHSNSTGEIDVWARWTDPVDNLGKAGPTDEDHDGYVFNRKIGYAETVAPFPKDQERTAPPRHEFGDTKHRLVKYRPIGTTRYREYFPASVTGDKANITWQGDNYGTTAAQPKGQDVNILSSARPAVPQVLYIVPTFQWQQSSDGLTRTRVGRGLRIYLDRPWYSSGVGELLGIVMPTLPISPSAMEDIRPYVSEWGADPAGNDKPPTQELRPSNFLNQAHAPLAGVALAERADVLTTVSGFAVEYSAKRKLWFCDIDMDPGNLYFPFVRLAITRLQPDSVLYPEDVRLSKVVKTEFAQLTADRTATLSVSRHHIDVTVYGLSSLDEVGVALPHFAQLVSTAAAGGGGGGPPNPLNFLTLNPHAGAGHVVHVHVERRHPSVRDDGKEPLGWTLVGTEIVLQSYTSPFSPDVFWKGTVRWTARDPAFDYRLVIREHELHHTDADSGLANPGPGGPTVGGRLVYLDTMALKP